MALKALDIFKLLPKTNCKKCGCPTCLAFAMKLAQKQASLDQCTDLSAESKSALEGSSAPPVRLITIGSGEGKVEVGNETVMFRHDESFYHQPGIAVLVSDKLSDKDLDAKVAAIAKLKFIRVGMELKIRLVAVQNDSGAAEPFVKAAAAVQKLGLPMILMSAEAAHIEKALAQGSAHRPLIHAATEEKWESFARLAKEKSCPLAVSAPDLDRVAALAEKVKGAGVEDIIIDLTAQTAVDTLQALTASRRLALKRKAKGVGYPAMVVSKVADPLANLSDCSAYTAKYAGIVVTTLDKPEQLLPILTVAQNIYTDPRKPIQVEAKLYEIGAVTPQSPLLITTNFSLTYYTVEGEVEACRVPAYIGVIDTEGTSVLTAFASDKLTSEKLAAFLASDEIKKKIGHKKVILPGYISAMSGSLKDDSGWTVLVGPREASGISKYLKTVWPTA
ncbi:MAG: acetyl-CoA decarbonylase/synthase complex subunit gamma [bacterium]